MQRIHARNSVRILVVNDDLGPPRLADVLRSALQQAKVEHCAFSRAESLLKSEPQFDLVVAHHGTGRMLLPLIWQFREVDHRTPLVIVSDGQRRETALAAGANAHLPCAECNRIGEVAAGLLAEDVRDGIYRQCA